MRIAVLMSTYNGEKYLDQQFASLASQTFASQVDVYIRDDGSNDQTFDIIERWKDRLAIVMIKGNNIGPAKSFWSLLENNEIVADYYAFCDQDDVWDKDKLENAVTKLTGEIYLWICNCRIIDSNGEIVKDARLCKAPKISLPRIFATGVAQGCAMVFAKELRDYILAKKIQCVPMHDIILMIYALSYGRVYWVNEPKFSYRVHESNVVAKINKKKTERIKTTIRNWKNSSKNSMAIVAEELLKNCQDLSENDRTYLARMSKYNSSIRNKWYLINYPEVQDINKASLRSYKLRILFGLL